VWSPARAESRPAAPTSPVVVLGPRLRSGRSGGLAGVLVAYTLDPVTRGMVQIIPSGYRWPVLALRPPLIACAPSTRP